MTGIMVPRAFPSRLLLLGFLFLPPFVLRPGSARAASDGRPPLILEEGAEYMEKKREEGQSVLYVEGHLLWRRGESRLRCGRARYLEDQGILYLSREVHLLEADRDLRADRVRYDRDASYAVATGGVILLASGGEVEVRADSMDYALDNREAWAFHRPRLRLRRAAREEGVESRTTRIDGDRLHMREGRFAAIAGEVRISGESLTGGADSLHYDLREDRIALWGDPWIEVGTYRLHGERIDLEVPGRVLRRGISRGAARGEQRSVATSGDGPPGPEGEPAGIPSGEAPMNWIEGDSIAMTFVDERLDSLTAAPAARSFYRVDREGTSEENYVLGEEIVVVWRKGRIDAVRVTGHGEGVYRKDEPGPAPGGGE